MSPKRYIYYGNGDNNDQGPPKPSQQLAVIWAFADVLGCLVRIHAHLQILPRWSTYDVPKKISNYRNPHQPTYEQCDTRREDRRFYASTAWRKVRAVKLAMTPLCECEDNCGQVADEVHHIIDRKLRPDLAVYLDNLQSLTTSCHSRITAARQGKGLIRAEYTADNVSPTDASTWSE